MNSSKVPEADILLDHGNANYNFNQDEKESYYLKVTNGNGDIKTFWGVELPNAIEESGAKIGERITIKNIGSKPVTVDGLIKDDNGLVIGKESISTHRNQWEIKVIPPRNIDKSPSADNEKPATGKTSQEQTKGIGEDNSIVPVDRKSMEATVQNQESNPPEKNGASHKQSPQNEESQQEQTAQCEVTDARKKSNNPIYKKEGYVLPETIKSAYTIYSGKFYDKKTDKLQFEDHGKKISTVWENRQIVADMVSVASVKNWDVLELKGTEQFRRMAWLEAGIRNIDTIGYEPTRKDLEHLKKLMQEQGRSSNDIAAAMDKRPTESANNEPAPASHAPTRGEQLNNEVALKVLESVLEQKQVSEQLRKEILATLSARINESGVKLPAAQMV